VPHIDNPIFTGMAKQESWKNPLFNFLFTQWGIIPLDRNGIDREAFQRSIEALSQGKILAISPEGTRSKTGRLLPGKPGVTALAVRSQAPMIPVGFYGYENFWQNLKRLRRTEFHVAVGKPFRLNLEGVALSRDVRQAVTDEIMYKIAELLPEKYRGHYHFDAQIAYRYLAEV
jgi:1-acyl-sn-glycerol-3-phosphate acyltransferase